MMVLSTMLLLAQALVAPDEPDAAPSTRFEVPRRDVTADQLESVFPGRWIMPEPPRPDARDEDAVEDLVTRMKRLAAETWPGDEETRFRTLGDLTMAAAGTSAPAERRALLEAFRKEQPAAWRRWGEVLEQVLTDDGLRKDDWSAKKDADDDGLFMAEPWSLKGQRAQPWRGLSGNKDVHQVAAWIMADLETLKAAENDYAAYADEPGSEYDVIHPVAGTHVALTDEEGTAQRVALQVQTVSQLPWPFGDLSCRMRVQYRIDGDGHLVTDVASTSGDFHWFAGRDVFVPLRTRDQAFAGFLVVRWFGFDVKGVPDGDGTRTSALRAGVGRLKRVAEARWSASEEQEPRTIEGAIPDFVLTGDRRMMP
ncbi:MAG: hypothetical protein ACYTCU_06360 [Planctomycetota bacterium]|jgi:hypothetical protein